MNQWHTLRVRLLLEEIHFVPTLCPQLIVMTTYFFSSDWTKSGNTIRLTGSFQILLVMQLILPSSITSTCKISIWMSSSPQSRITTPIIRASKTVAKVLSPQARSRVSGNLIRTEIRLVYGKERIPTHTEPNFICSPQESLPLNPALQLQCREVWKNKIQSQSRVPYRKPFTILTQHDHQTLTEFQQDSLSPHGTE